jgi:hypothetical protein
MYRLWKMCLDLCDQRHPAYPSNCTENGNIKVTNKKARYFLGSRRSFIGAETGTAFRD